MQSLDLEHVHKTGTVADDQDIAFADGVRPRIAGDGVIAAFRDHLRAGLDHGATVDELLHKFMLLEADQGLLRIEIVIFPVGPDDHAHGDLVLAEGVHNAAAEDARPDERGPDGPAHGVHDAVVAELLILLGRDLDQLLGADGEEFVRFPLEARLLYVFFGQQAVAAFG
ncbi:MAG: hypothetical protein BWY71_01455 [Planctomycetes bacterium ADurb.Bin412]|nr:MAG: hypothetical protein BWY71_01455 [Planctomycetes bacterium ADurb.Bin412]